MKRIKETKVGGWNWKVKKGKDFKLREKEMKREFQMETYQYRMVG